MDGAPNGADRLQEIESFSDHEAPAQSEPEFPPQSAARRGSAAAASRGLEPRAVLSSLNAVVYDWDIASDRLSWGANVGETLAAFSAASLETGAAFAELVTANSETSRFQAIHNASARDQGEGAPYRVAYRSRGRTARIARSRISVAGSPTPAAGRRARTASSGFCSATKKRDSAPRKRLRTLARARPRAGERSTKRSNRASPGPSRARRFSPF